MLEFQDKFRCQITHWCLLHLFMTYRTTFIFLRIKIRAGSIQIYFRVDVRDKKIQDRSFNGLRKFNFFYATPPLTLWKAKILFLFKEILEADLYRLAPINCTSVPLQISVSKWIVSINARLLNNYDYSI